MIFVNFVNEFKVLFFGDAKWIYILSATCGLLLMVVFILIIYHKRMIRYKNKGIVMQIFARDKCEGKLQQVSSENTRLYKRLKQVQAAAKMPELYLLATEKPISASFTEEHITDGSFKIFPLRSEETAEEE